VDCVKQPGDAGLSSPGFSKVLSGLLHNGDNTVHPPGFQHDNLDSALYSIPPRCAFLFSPFANICVPWSGNEFCALLLAQVFLCYIIQRLNLPVLQLTIFGNEFTYFAFYRRCGIMYKEIFGKSHGKIGSGMENPMQQQPSKPCLECGGRRILCSFGLEPYVWIRRYIDQGSVTSTLRAYVCLNCGYTSFYTSDPENLKIKPSK